MIDTEKIGKGEHIEPLRRAGEIISIPIITQDFYGFPVSFEKAIPYLISRGIYKIASTKGDFETFKNKLEQIINRSDKTRHISSEEISWTRELLKYTNDILSNVLNEQGIQFRDVYEIKIKKIKKEEQIKLLSYLFKDKKDLLKNGRKYGDFWLVDLDIEGKKFLESQKRILYNMAKVNIRLAENVLNYYQEYIVSQEKIISDKFKRLRETNHDPKWDDECEEILVKGIEEILLEKKIPEGKK